MKIGDFFDITNFGGVLAAAVLAAAIMFIIQLRWSANNKLVKMEGEHIQLSKEDNEEFGEVYGGFEKINATLADHSMILGEIQSQLEDLNGTKSAVDANETKIEGLDQKTE